MRLKKLVFVSLTIIVLTSCNMQQLSVNDNQAQTLSLEDPSIVSSRLKRIAQSHPLVKSATSVIIGKVAMIGIELDSTIDHLENEQVKRDVTESIQEDPYGTNIFVTTDSYINKRLREIAEQVKKGHPVNGFAAELIEMMRPFIPHEKKPVA